MLRILALGGVFLALTACATTTPSMTKDAAKPALAPLEQVLKNKPHLVNEQANVEIRQVFNRVEGATAAQVTVLESALLDDSVAAVRTTYQFKRAEQVWQLVDRSEQYKCKRGSNTKTFQAGLCP